MFKKILAFGLILACLTGCGDAKKDIPEDTPEHLYTQAKVLFDKKDYERAAAVFDEVERQHPYSVWASRSQVMMAYAYYLGGEYDNAILALDRFIQLHPGNKNTPYAYYLKGLSYFEQISDVEREQSITEDARATFERLIAFFPHSVYVVDARAKMQIIDDQLAGKEMAIGRYYQKNGDYISAINRFQVVLADHAKTNQVPEAMYRLVACYAALGMKEQAEKLALELNKKFPDDAWNGRAQKVIEKIK